MSKVVIIGDKCYMHNATNAYAWGIVLKFS